MPQVNMIISSFKGTAKLHTWTTTEKTFQVVKNAKLIWTNLKGHIYHARRKQKNRG